MEEIAEKTEGMTGADLRGLVTTAILAAKQRTRQDVKICQDDLLDALKNTTPSVTKKEIEKYEKIYSRFSSGKVNHSEVEQRVTLL